jgi:lactate dehydrogenase-like 2-hydroxyacid dehydrogenase
LKKWNSLLFVDKFFLPTARLDRCFSLQTRVAALSSGKLRAAGIDAYNHEPNVDPRLVALPNTFLMPHIGSATAETRDAMGFRALDNLDAFFAGRAPGDRVA